MPWSLTFCPALANGILQNRHQVRMPVVLPWPLALLGYDRSRNLSPWVTPFIAGQRDGLGMTTRFMSSHVFIYFLVYFI